LHHIDQLRQFCPIVYTAEVMAMLTGLQKGRCGLLP